MKVIDAFWEKRNLGVDTVEFEISPDDTPEAVIDIIKNNEKEYNVIKAPSGRTELNYMMSELGYVYCETMFHLIHDLDLSKVNSIQKRMASAVRYAVMDDNDIDMLFCEIGKGMFTTDRIALNPFFGIDCANTRYINWIRDELSRGTPVYKMLYKNDTVGFFTFKKIDDGVYFPFLAGMYEKYIRSGLGINIVIKPIELAQEMNAKYNSTYVSSNNNSALMTHLSLGFQVKELINVFTKNK